MLGYEVFNKRHSGGIEHLAELFDAILRVAAAEADFLREVGKALEAFGPAEHTIPALLAGDGKAGHDGGDHPLAQPSGQASIAAREQARIVFAIARKKLIRSHAREQNLYSGLACRLANQISVDARGIAYGLVKSLDQPRQNGSEVRRDFDRPELDAELIRNLARIRKVVRHVLIPAVGGAE